MSNNAQATKAKSTKEVEKKKANLQIVPSTPEPTKAAEEATTPAAESAQQAPQTGVILIPLDLIDPNPYQPRKHFDEEKLDELKESIKASGMLQFPVVRRVGDRYQLIAGERRTRAARLLEWKDMKVNVIEMSDEAMATAALVENLQREDVSQLSTARAIKAAMENFNIKQGDMAGKLGVTQPKISQLLALTKLCDPLTQALEQNEISPSIGRILGGLPEKYQILFDIEKLKKATVQGLQEAVNKMKHVDSLIPLEPISEEDSLMTKFVKVMNEHGKINVLRTVERYYGEIKTVTGFRPDVPYMLKSKHDEIRFLDEGLGKSAGFDNKIHLQLKGEDDELLPIFLQFMELYCPYEKPQKKNEEKNKKEQGNESKEPSAPRMTKEEKEQKLAAAQEASPVPVLTISKPTTKSDRLLQRIQENQGEPIHELSQRCYNCRFFKPEGESYTERCGAKYGFSLHQLDRYKVEGKPDIFTCNKYSPTEEQLEKDKQEGLDIELTMLMLLLNSHSNFESDVPRLMPQLEGMNRDQVLEAYKTMDAKDKAYLVSLLAHRFALTAPHIADKRMMILPNGEQFKVQSGSITGPDTDI